MDFIESYQIKSRLDYFTLKDNAQEKLFKVSKRWVVLAVEGIALIVAGVLFISLLISIIDGFRITDAIIYMTVVVTFYVCIFAVIMIIKAFRKLRTAIDDYQYDLRRIQEKLTWSEIYMDIPQEDYEEFDSVIKLFRSFVKRMKKST